MRISDGSSDVCSSDLTAPATLPPLTLASAPTRFNGPYERTVALQARVGNLREQLTIAGTEQAQLLQDMAIHELEGQRQQIEFMDRSEEHTSELQSLMRISYAVFCLKKKKKKKTIKNYTHY